MNQREPITAEAAREWLGTIGLRYASRTLEDCLITRHITMDYVGAWIVRVRKTGAEQSSSITTTLYHGADLDTAVAVFNEQLS